MKLNTHQALIVAAMTAVVLGGTSGCSMFTRLSEVGEYPGMSQISNPQAQPGYRPVNLPMPAAQPYTDNPNSLWRPGARAFFKDIRAKEVGDTVTVRLNLSDSAKMQNVTKRKRDDNEAMGVDSILGYETKLGKFLPNAVDNANLFKFATKSNTDGDGNIGRSEKIELTFAAMVVQVLPNGSLVISGHQEMRVNYEMRELMLTGVVRPQDIDSDNSVSHERIAEMRVAYGGRGTMSDLQQPRWGTQIMDILLPF
ncbi:MAG: flagellar basal body L-ring protein FlgH [Rhodospirillales bacterium]|nr:flagellar basal body L-ring protein FlgH [Rhodospirillales bacterium]